MSVPKVSVCVVAYNHEAFIRQCLQSLVEQQTAFDFEVIVGDDASTDGTVAIVREFENNYPNIVRLIRHENNIGPTANYLSVHSNARGQYVAHLDGDDCALPGKLQAQADYLDHHEDVAFAVHAAQVMGRRKVLKRRSTDPVKASLSDLLVLGTYFVHSSVMYRKSLEPIRGPGPERVDFYFHVERANSGLIFFDDRVLGCYRVHPGGISQSRAKRKMLEACYEDAFDRALELGANARTVQVGRLKRRMAFAVDSLVAGETSGYREKITLRRDDMQYASRKHRMLHYTRFAPSLVRFYLWLKARKSAE